jgi:hypothetical protein
MKEDRSWGQAKNKRQMFVDEQLSALGNGNFEGSSGGR